MMDAATLLALAVLVEAIVIAALCASVPALWWVHLRGAAKMERLREVTEGKLELARIELAEARADVAKLDDVVDKLCRAANVGAGQ